MTIAGSTRLKVVQEIIMPDSVVAMNVFYFLTDFLESQTDQDVLDTIETWMETLYETIDDFITDGCTMGTMTLYTYDPVLDQWDNVGTASPTVTFANIGDMLPHGVCMMVRAYTETPRTIGRKYLPGFGEGETTDGAWNANAITAAAAFGAAWDNTATVAPNQFCKPGVFSKTAHVVYEMNDVQVVLTDPTYQRRRRPGVGI